VATRLRKSTLYKLSPPVPMAVLTLLHECYGQQVMRSPIYGTPLCALARSELSLMLVCACACVLSTTCR
jgi:hypothetical protein